MAQMGEQSTVEAALVARQTYMEMGADGPHFGRIPLEDLPPLLEAVDKVQLPASAALDVGWLEFEAADSMLFSHPQSDWEPRFSPDILAARAKSRWKNIFMTPNNRPLTRAKAMLAVGSISIYSALDIGTRNKGQETNVLNDYMLPYQVPAAEILLKAFDRDRDPDPEYNRELYLHTLWLLLSQYIKQTDYMIGMPAPTRFQEEGNDASYDSVVMVPGEVSNNYYLRMAAGEPTITGRKSITIPPSMLENEAFDPNKPHGTLRALLKIARATDKGKPLSYLTPEALHTKRVTVREIVPAIISLTRQGRGYENLSTDITTGVATLAEAWDWYASLLPQYYAIPKDKAAFENAVNAYETVEAVGKKKLTPIESLQLGSLLMELGVFPGESACYDRAEEVFELTASRAEVQKPPDYVTYICGKIGAANAKVYQSIQNGEGLDDEQLVTYRRKLYEIGLAVWQGVQNEGKDAHGKFLPIMRSLSSMLLINSDPAGAHLAISPTIRQQTSKGELAGIDTLVLPLGSGGFRMNNAGRLRFGELVGSKLDSGIITFTPEDLADKNWTDDVVVLGATVDEMARFLSGPEDFVPDEWVEYMRTSLIQAADLSRKM